MSQAFGGWLIAQSARHDWVGLLAHQASRDPRFPKGGDPEVVRKHLSTVQTDGDMYEALDDAEAEWLRAAH